MEHIIKKEITAHLTEHRIVTEAQYGFRKGRSCQLQLLESIDQWSEAIDQNKMVDTIFLDFQKAFDSVPHLRLLQKVKAYGIAGNVHSWLSDFQVGRRQKVTVKGTGSDWKSVESGVPQGSVLGPTLFLLYVNDLPNEVNNTTKLFADDTKVSLTFSKEHECNRI